MKFKKQKNCLYCNELLVEITSHHQKYHPECWKKFKYEKYSNNISGKPCKICGIPVKGIGTICWTCKHGKPKKKSEFKVKRNCVICGNKLILTSGRDLYCSVSCQKKSMSGRKTNIEYKTKIFLFKKKRICIVCNNEFDLKGGNQFFCSESCKKLGKNFGVRLTTTIGKESRNYEGNKNKKNFINEKLCFYCHFPIHDVYKSRKYHVECRKKVFFEYQRKRNKERSRRKHPEMTDEEFEIWHKSKRMESTGKNKLGRKKKKKKRVLLLIQNVFPREIKVDRHHIIKGLPFAVPLPRETHLFVNGDRLDEHFEHNRKWIEKIYGIDFVSMIRGQ